MVNPNSVCRPSAEILIVASSITRKEVVVIPDHCYETENWVGEDWVPVTHYFPNKAGRDNQIRLNTALDVLFFYYSGYKILAIEDVEKVVEVKCPVCGKPFKAIPSKDGMAECPDGCGYYPVKWAGEYEQFMKAIELVKLARRMAETGEWTKGRSISSICKSRKYKPGQLVHPFGHGWGSVGNWDKNCYFISSYRLHGNGMYAVLGDKGKVKILTNIRFPGEKR